MLIPKTITFVFFDIMAHSFSDYYRYLAMLSKMPPIHPSIKNFEVEVPNTFIANGLWKRLVDDAHIGVVVLNGNTRITGFGENPNDVCSKRVFTRVNDVLGQQEFNMNEVKRFIRRECGSNIQYAFMYRNNLYGINIER